MGVKMKYIVIFTFFLATFVFSQEYDSTYIGANRALDVKGDKVLTFSIPKKNGDLISALFYNGNHWRNISQDTMPTIHLHNSRCIFSSFSDNLYVTGQYHLWEFDGKDWVKHAIYDSLYHRRRFEDIIELPDSSFLIIAITLFTTGNSGNVTYVDKAFHEVLKFKNGVFTTIKSRWENGLEPLYQKLKSNKDGTYSMFTTDESKNNLYWELVTYYIDGSIVRKDVFPDLKDFGFKISKYTLDDYLFDSKGSLWFLTSTEADIAVDNNGIPILDSNGLYTEFVNFVGLIEVLPNGDINLYNDNIGIQKSLYQPRTFTIDKEDNLWFFYNYRWTGPYLFPSLYKLHSDRKFLTEYRQETLLQNSRIYNGGNSNYQFIAPSIGYSLLVFSDTTKSLFIATSGPPLLQFFPEKVLTSASEQITPIQLYPNPVTNEKNLIIESNLLSTNLQLWIVLYDINGGLVRKEFVHSVENQVTFNTERLSCGTYFVSILSDSKTILQTKFIKE